MRGHGVSFSIVSHAAWAPGLTTPEHWAQWARSPYPIVAGAEPGVKPMAPMLRRRAGTLGKMALEVAYQCLEGRTDVPSVFCSRHGETARAVALLTDLVRDEPLSPTVFGMAVHNATAGLLTIARAERSNHIAMAAGAASVENAVIEACGLLADGAPLVLLVAYDDSLPGLFAAFDDCSEQPHAWAWLMAPADTGADSDPDPDPARYTLEWHACGDAAPGRAALPGGLEVLRFHAGGLPAMERVAEGRRWRWSRDA